MKRHTKTGIHTEKRRHLVSYMNQRIEGFQKIPAVLTDRACKISALSFLALQAASESKTQKARHKQSKFRFIWGFSFTILY